MKLRNIKLKKMCAASLSIALPPSFLLKSPEAFAILPEAVMETQPRESNYCWLEVTRALLRQRGYESDLDEFICIAKYCGADVIYGLNEGIEQIRYIVLSITNKLWNVDAIWLSGDPNVSAQKAKELLSRLEERQAVGYLRDRHAQLITSIEDSGDGELVVKYKDSSSTGNAESSKPANEFFSVYFGAIFYIKEVPKEERDTYDLDEIRNLAIEARMVSDGNSKAQDYYKELGSKMAKVLDFLERHTEYQDADIDILGLVRSLDEASDDEISQLPEFRDIQQAHDALLAKIIDIVSSVEDGKYASLADDDSFSEALLEIFPDAEPDHSTLVDILEQKLHEKRK